jgi:hypothetical protein
MKGGQGAGLARPPSVLVIGRDRVHDLADQHGRAIELRVSPTTAYSGADAIVRIAR